MCFVVIVCCLGYGVFMIDMFDFIDGYYDLFKGKIVVVVIYLDMIEKLCVWFVFD